MSEKIYVQIDNEKIEATGEILDYVLESQLEAKKTEEDKLAEIQAKADSRTSALAKLAALGLTEEEIAAL
jgi:DNA-binding NarL/FixJ family response regulator